MSHLQLIYAPDPIFKKKAESVVVVDKEIQNLIDEMYKTLYLEQGIGLGANMVGVLKRIAIVDIQENSEKNPRTLINPDIIWHSDETQTFEEASLCFPGISAKITRPKTIKLRYLDYNGESKEMEAEGFLATVIQHEVDYLDGIVFLDYLSRLKQDRLMMKMKKFIKNNPPHVHTEACSH